MAKAKSKKKQVQEEEPKTLEAAFEKTLKTVGLADALQLADNTDDYTGVPTDWPGINQLIGGESQCQGIPEHCHIEVFSEEPHVGKTSFCLGVGVAYQRRGKKVAVISIETKIPNAYFKQLGFILSKEEAEKAGLYALRLLQPKVKPEQCETETIYVNQVLDLVGLACRYFDLVIIDSVDALISETDAAKPSEEGSMMGGVSKPIKDFFRKHALPVGSCLWINHMSQGLGQYAKSYRTGGKAIPRYCTVCIKIDRVELLKENKDAMPYGFSSKLTTVKNRVSAPFRFTILNYIFGEGFSTDFDYYNMAIKQGLVTKNGSWNSVGEDPENPRLKAQGYFGTYQALKENPEVMAWLKQMIDGEDVTAEELSEAEQAEAALAAAEIDAEEEQDVAA